MAFSQIEMTFSRLQGLRTQIEMAFSQIEMTLFQNAVVRLVRCPNCGKLLPEIAKIPVYKCGSCNTTLQAKYRGRSRTSSKLSDTQPEPTPLQSDGIKDNCTEGYVQESNGNAQKVDESRSQKERTQNSTTEVSCSDDSSQRPYGGRSCEKAHCRGVSVECLLVGEEQEIDLVQSLAPMTSSSTSPYIPHSLWPPPPQPPISSSTTLYPPISRYILLYPLYPPPQPYIPLYPPISSSTTLHNPLYPPPPQPPISSFTSPYIPHSRSLISNGMQWSPIRYRMASSTTSPSHDDVYNVFINHRGPDVKKGLASHIYRRLLGHGLKVFLDQPEMQEGELITLQIKRAIGTASVHIAIFSKGYADSSWCLDELLDMLDTVKSGSAILPVFYNVQPSDLRWTQERGVYGRALRRLQKKRTFDKKPRHDSDTIEKWRKALSDVSLISGFELSACNGDEGQLVDKVVQRVLKKVPSQK